MTQTHTINNKYPPGVYHIIANEGAERFSFYGMRSILASFLVLHFFNPTMDPALRSVAEAKANETTHFFVSLAYALPFLGGLMADWFFGKYRVIFYISIVYCFGHLCLAMFDNRLDIFKCGLLLIAIGAGGIKSCVSANLGDQFTNENRHLMSKVYGWFYFSINAGSVLSTILIPLVYAYYGPKWAFGIPGILMAIATLIFINGRKIYVSLPPSGINKITLYLFHYTRFLTGGKKKKASIYLMLPKKNLHPKR
ncbi:MAG: MFS transporter [Mucilaginibacter sp.]|uniref:POT-type proton-dependent oligopeptide transporter n=1 Tax=Mucilaginibacter sp. TaxID=1882438 RepID=UPI003267D454